MNKSRRKNLNEAISHMEKADSILRFEMSGESDSFNNLPESLQCSSRGESMENAIDMLEDAIDSVSDAIDSVREAINN